MPQKHWKRYRNKFNETVFLNSANIKENGKFKTKLEKLNVNDIAHKCTKTFKIQSRKKHCKKTMFFSDHSAAENQDHK